MKADSFVVGAKVPADAYVAPEVQLVAVLANKSERPFAAQVVATPFEQNEPSVQGMHLSRLDVSATPVVH